MKLFNLFSIVVLVGSSIAQEELIQKEGTYQADGFWCETGIRLNNAYALYDNLTFDQCTSQCKNENRCVFVSMQSHNCQKFDTSAALGTDALYTTCTKLNTAVGRWSLACFASGKTCLTNLYMSTTKSQLRDEDVKSADDWNSKVEATLKLGFTFNEKSQSASSPTGKALIDSFQQSKSSKKQCSNAVKPDSKCITSSSQTLYVWQFEATARINEYTGRPSQATVDTCLSQITTSNHHVPRCLPGTCADCECITCNSREDRQVQESQEALGFQRNEMNFNGNLRSSRLVDGKVQVHQ